VTILTALPFATLSVNLLNVTPLALNLKTLSATSNARNPNAKLNAPIKDVKCSTVLNVSPSVNNPIALLTVKLLNPSANPSVKNPDVTGNVINPPALNPNVSWSVKIPIAFLKLNVALALWELPELLNLSPSSKKLLKIKNVVNVNINM
jgi:hypothetical protein